MESCKVMNTFDKLMWLIPKLETAGAGKKLFNAEETFILASSCITYFTSVIPHLQIIMIWV